MLLTSTQHIINVNIIRRMLLISLIVDPHLPLFLLKESMQSALQTLSTDVRHGLIFA